MSKCICDDCDHKVTNAAVCEFHLTHKSSEKSPRTRRQIAKEFGCIARIGGWGIKSPMVRIKCYLMRLSGQSYPRPSIIIPLDGWVTDPNEIIKAIRLDDELGISAHPVVLEQSKKEEEL